MYAGPIMRTYYSAGAYSQDAAIMASYGYRVVNIETYNETHGLALTLLLIFGLLLTPFCIGVVILCFLPFAFSKRFNVSYLYQPPQTLAPGPFPYSQPLAPPAYSQPLYRPTPYSQPLMPPTGASMHAPAMPHFGYPTQPSRQPPQQHPPQASWSARFREGLENLRQMWARSTPVQRALTIAATVVVVASALALATYVIVVLVSGGATPA